MISRTMAEAQLPKRVDAAKLVDSNQQFSAQIDSQKLGRLLAAVERCEQPVDCHIEFFRDAENHRVLKGQCKTQVTMQCQRCLGSVSLEVESEFELGLVFDDERAKQLPRRLEPVIVDEDGYFDLWQVLEDEVLLSLPPFPLHPQDECQLKQPEPDTNAEPEVERENPFSVLAQLKKN
ncbi:hypothetical protein CHH28_14905 [Bacterioplanes sanyensis]|uniref:Large ribosomal RNA subunit accumulation protein YceD n=1 Tax=Bacterioplanes sanyensis TaxID=1249553 RepID=A0A222FMI9_9GAMM|nr:YceD family protein [Bacterioplanes sanyensis]ASP39882.1 hypothetical protein CHH28_14905 [Bacterioplanes sanyensis]